MASCELLSRGGGGLGGRAEAGLEVGEGGLELGEGVVGELLLAVEEVPEALALVADEL